jgi:hypothetical protein
VKFILPHDLSESSFAAIAKHGAAYFSRDGDSISPLAGVVSQKEGRKERSMNPVALLINPAKLPAIAQRLHQISNGLASAFCALSRGGA